MRRFRKPDGRHVEVRLEHLALERQGRLILDDVSWSVRAGQRWVLAGGNGAGKTQLLKVIAGDVWPTSRDAGRPAAVASPSRRYRWRDETFSSPFEVKEEIGYIGPERQDKYERYEWNHSVLEVVGTGVHRTDIPLNTLSGADRTQIRRLLSRLGILSLASRAFLTLSYGERRLTLLARALAAQPRLLLLDELINGLDPTNRGRALDWLESTARSPLPWVLSSHRIEDIPGSATHALVLEAGRIVYKGAVKDAPLSRWLGPAPKTRARARLKTASSGSWLIRLEEASVFLDYKPILQNLTLTIRKGECWVVHGRNGSGKTTLLRTLYGDHGVAYGGRLARAGIEPGVPLEEFKRRVGIVAPHLQSGHPRHLSVAEVVQSGRYSSIGLNDPASRADREAARRALEALGLGELSSRTIGEISYGQLRRVLFARALVNEPVLLLLDEPFTGIDAPTRAVLQAQIESLTAAGTSVVISTHHREEWPGNATHELELLAGRIAYAGPVRRKSVPRRVAARTGPVGARR